MSTPVLVVGATGFLGQKVVRALVGRGKSVRALVRDGTDPGPLRDLGVEIVRGNMLDAPSLDRALEGAAALVTTAIGYSARKPGDTLASWRVTCPISGRKSLPRTTWRQAGFLSYRCVQARSSTQCGGQEI
ncbi:MAG: SDR family oxidoreductase [Spirochaetia bacterium]